MEEKAERRGGARRIVIERREAVREETGTFAACSTEETSVEVGEERCMDVRGAGCSVLSGVTSIVSPPWPS